MDPAGPEATSRDEAMVPVGRISGLYGTLGWVKVYSYTDPREGILDYDPWFLSSEGSWVPRRVMAGRTHGKGVVAQLEGVADREAARALLETEVAVRRSQLPPLEDGDFYWADLIGLEVATVDGTSLGRVVDLMETGANDVLVVAGERERLIPYVPGPVVTSVDLEGGRLTVDWDPEY